METLKFVIVGHIDHGKSTLIGRLFFDTNSLPPDKMEEVRKTSKELGREIEFAFLMDHLREEREQGITIDTAQTFFKTDKREYVIIDAPGHIEFVKNMITGASQAEAAVLIVDGASGVQEQTRRHAYILNMLGLEQVIVVINKMDLIGFSEKRFNEVRKDIQGFLKSINVIPSLYIPISAMKGDNVAHRSENMGWYTGPSVLEGLDSLKSRVPAENRPLIFPVQDVYKIGDKRIIVGRIETGSVGKGQKIGILPDSRAAKVKSIEKFMAKPGRSYTGESTGITTEEPVFLDRGNVICELGREPSVSDTFRANVFWISKKEFNKESRIILKCATQEVTCKVEKIEKRINSSTLELIKKDADVIKNLEVGEVIIKTKKPIVVEPFNKVQELGRFVFVRDENICAGGIITAMNI